MDCVTGIRPLILIDQFKKRLGNKSILATAAWWQIAGEISCISSSGPAVRVVFPVPFLHVLFGETINRGSGPTSSVLSLPWNSPISVQYYRS